MAEGKKSVLLYCDLIHTIEKMDNETAGEFFKHYLRYINDKEPVTENPLVDITFESVKQNLKRDLAKWELRAEKSRENGKKGGRPTKPNVTQETQQVISEPRKPVKDTVTVNVTGTDNKEVDSTTAKAIDFDNLLKYINLTFGRQFKIINDTVKTKYKARVKEGYTSDNIREAINNCKKDPYHIETNYKYCTPEFFSRSVKLDLHSSIGTPEKSSDPLVDYVNQHIEQYGNS